MIPASYVFKGIYHQHWEEPEPARSVVHKPSFFSGLMTPLAGVIETVLLPRLQAVRHHGTHPAYE